jgi:hypothetical protein
MVNMTLLRLMFNSTGKLVTYSISCAGTVSSFGRCNAKPIYDYIVERIEYQIVVHYIPRENAEQDFRKVNIDVPFTILVCCRRISLSERSSLDHIHKYATLSHQSRMYRFHADRHRES